MSCPRSAASPLSRKAVEVPAPEAPEERKDLNAAAFYLLPSAFWRSPSLWRNELREPGRHMWRPDFPTPLRPEWYPCWKLSCVNFWAALRRALHEMCASCHFVSVCRSCNPAMGAMPPRNVLRQCSKRLRAACLTFQFLESCDRRDFQMPSTASEGCRKGLHGRSRAKSSHKRRSLALSI
ncbi:hypothetical protein AK812_SmicGene5750 [Symbiodinium microadriaticum]|uniref:Uncharacterized protein n=1 Tax=Symbiodinium microadriaticum TaxID=2951 RepID=A0A1Q9ET33_SYMMI|nr:hypothetical protein AK812_SmicGene5750 [Symbiodinium microadriaticum]